MRAAAMPLSQKGLDFKPLSNTGVTENAHYFCDKQ
jgi:hypothetical protein